MKLQVMQELDDIELWVSAKSFIDAFYVMRKNNKSADVQRAFVKSMEFLNVCAVDADDIRKTAERRWPDFEDCLVDVCAEKVKADYLLTRDRKGFENSHTTALSSRDFFAKLESELGLVYEDTDW